MKRFSSDKVKSLDSYFNLDGKVCIVVHSHPDGDALGSGTALLRYLTAIRGLDCVLIVPDAVPDTLSFIIKSDRVLDATADPQSAKAEIASADLVVCLDMNVLSRTGALEEQIRSSSARKILIDHHENPDEGSFDLVFSETAISSASELLYWILKNLGDSEPLPRTVLEPLLTGMTTDTNNFANSVYPSTFEMASGILSAGVDRDAIIESLYGSFRENRVRAMGTFLKDKLKITPFGLAYMVITREEYDALGLKAGETEGFVNIPLSVADVRMSILLKQDDPDYFSVSIRSKRGVSAYALARECFHGGGHEQASGGRLYFPGDISSREEAGKYIESVAARFLQ